MSKTYIPYGDFELTIIGPFEIKVYPYKFIVYCYEHVVSTGIAISMDDSKKKAEDCIRCICEATLKSLM